MSATPFSFSQFRGQPAFVSLIVTLAVGCGGNSPGPPGPAGTADNAATPKNATPAQRGAGAGGTSKNGAGVEALIDDLVNVAEPGFGYSVTFSGTDFLPYEGTEEMGTLILGAAQRSRSQTLRAIVDQGADSVPSLIKHIGDSRATKMPPVGGMMWMDFSDEYDFNRRTMTTAPPGVNRRDFGSGKKHPEQHTITVGDLCFVALGQIVNRHFSATRYQPTGGVIVSSPTYSEALKNVILDDWSTLTPEKHQSLLIEDFSKPDFANRRTGAYLRLALYYPGAVEELVVDAISQPTFDVFAIEKFCRETLYRIDSDVDRKMVYDDFIRDHGPAFAAGIRNQLFDDLDAGDRFGSRPNELLIQFYGLPANAKSSDRPASDYMSQADQARFIAALVHDDSRKVGDTVLELFQNEKNDVYFATACLRCLANRGYDDFLLQQLAEINTADVKPRAVHAKYIGAIATARAPAVRTKLFDILRESANEAYFVAALPAIDPAQASVVADAARKLLARLPDDTSDGQELLQMIAKAFPGEAKAVFQSFLSTGSANRAETMCRVLWYGHPLSKEILAPLLDDRRVLPGFSITMRVCDRAAQAISHTTKDIQFNSEWSQATKNAEIEKLKKYCAGDAR